MLQERSSSSPLGDPHAGRLNDLHRSAHLISQYSNISVSRDPCGLLAFYYTLLLYCTLTIFFLSFFFWLSHLLVQTPSDLLLTVALEHLGTASGSQDGVPRDPRYAPAGERAYLGRLMARHGTDVGAMARDRRLNWDQRTEGELRRGLRRSGLLSLGGKGSDGVPR